MGTPTSEDARVDLSAVCPRLRDPVHAHGSGCIRFSEPFVIKLVPIMGGTLEIEMKSTHDVFGLVEYIANLGSEVRVTARKGTLGITRHNALCF